MINYEKILKRLEKYVDYNRDTGSLVYKKAIGPCRPGWTFGTIDDRGYLKATVGGRRYMVADIVWLLETGELPPRGTRPADGDPMNVKFSNLIEGRRFSVEAVSSRSITIWKSFLDLVKTRFPDSVYDYSKVHTIKRSIKIAIGCEHHGWFMTYPQDFLKRGCPKCRYWSNAAEYEAFRARSRRALTTYRTIEEQTK